MRLRLLALLGALATCGDVAYADDPPIPNACEERSSDACGCMTWGDLYRIRAKADAWDKLERLPAAEAPPVSTSAWAGIGSLLAAALVAVLKLLL